MASSEYTKKPHPCRMCDATVTVRSPFCGDSCREASLSVTHNKKPLSELLVVDSDARTSNVRLRLIKEGVREHRCECCSLTEWMGQRIPLQLDHINGVKRDFRSENLRLLCPNCHAQTDTYCGKNKLSSKSRNVTR